MHNENDKIVNTAKDFLVIQNNEDQLMFVISHNEETEEPSTDAKILYGENGPHAVLLKNDDHAIILDYLKPETLDMLNACCCEKLAFVTEIEYNEELLQYNIDNEFNKDTMYQLFEYAEAHHALKACYEVVLEKIDNFDERFSHFIDKELEALEKE